MQIQVKEDSFCDIHVTYVADPDLVLSKKKEVLENLKKDAKKITVPGYRKGKAPLNALKARFKTEIEKSLIQELLSRAEEDIIFETKMKYLFYPQVLNQKLTDTQFECQLRFLKKPDFELKPYTGLNIPKPHLPETQAEMTEKILQDLRVTYGDVVPFQDNDFVQANDKVTMDVSCKRGEEVVAPLTMNGHFYSLGEKELYPGFDDNLLGMKVDEERTFTVDGFEFTVKIHMGAKHTPAPLDDAFAQKVGFETFDLLRQQVETVSGNRIQVAEAKALTDQVTNRLLADNEIQLPEWLVKIDLEDFVKKNKIDMSQVDPEQQENIHTMVVKRIKLALILDSIRAAEPECQHSQNELERVIKAEAAQSGQDPEVYLQKVKQNGQIFGIEAALRNRATIEWLISKANIVE